MRLTKDDERARRICSLALEFMNARRPVSSSEVWRGFYPHLSADSFRRAFSRDRQALAACGVHVREHDGGSAESSWSADREISFAQGPELEAAEAAALHIACLPLLADPGFALADELRFALAKLSRAFAESTAPGAGATAAGGGRVLSTLRSCLVEGVAARIRYTDARGSGSERLVAPWGFFGLRGTLYLVAARVDETGPPRRAGPAPTASTASRPPSGRQACASWLPRASRWRTGGGCPSRWAPPRRRPSLRSRRRPRRGC